MGYMHIQNLYNAKVTTNQMLLCEERVYALEKVHGTSAHIKWLDGELSFFSGGERYDNFVALFETSTLDARFMDSIGERGEVVVYGEAYGGKQQGMGDVYGKALRFIAFDVKLGDEWLDVPNAERFVEALGLEFVPYWETDTKIASLDALRDQPSTVAKLNGCGEQVGEGIVIRPLQERYYKDARLIAKHKTAKFSEHLNARSVVRDAAKEGARQSAVAVADDWVTPMRLEHVLDSLRAYAIAMDPTTDPVIGIEDTSAVCRVMIADVLREGEGEIVNSRELRAAVGHKTVALFHTKLRNALAEMAAG